MQAIVITRFPRVWVVAIPGQEGRFFDSEYQAESYAEIRSLVMDLPVVRKVA
jgi:hypothetical protein